MFSASSLASLPASERERLIKSLSPTELEALAASWRFWARPSQVAPDGEWDYWLILAGRGFGKTRAGAEWILEQVDAGKKRIALAGRTAADVRDTMVRGESGVLHCARGARRPRYKAHERCLVWPNGAHALLLSADEPDLFRGPQFDAAWADEIAAWRYPESWDNLLMGLRLGDNPKACITTTPRPTALVRSLINDPRTVSTRGSTFDNRANLATGFLNAIVRKYEGTRLGRQELQGEILEDNPGALWTYQMLDSARASTIPPMARVLVAIDPSATSHEDSDECGIVAVGLGQDGFGYVLRDVSGVYSPAEWASLAIATARSLEADAIVAEVNNGGDMVENTIRAVDDNVRVISVRASRGKLTRAEPVAALYEQGRVKHVDLFPELEDQMCQWSPAAGMRSPDRMDALVWGFTELLLGESFADYHIPSGLIG